MFNNILLLDEDSPLGQFMARSLKAEGYNVEHVPTAADAWTQVGVEWPNLILVNNVGRDAAWRAATRAIAWPVPVVNVAETADGNGVPGRQLLALPFSFQDLLLIVQDALHQRTLDGRRPFHLSLELLDKIEQTLTTLRRDLRARCVILSTSAGRLIKTAGVVEPGVAISLSALMAGSFTATAQAAQLLNQEEVFDSSLQESEGFGLYAIRLYEKLILSVAFSDKITIGLVRHCTAEATIQILEAMAQQTPHDAELAADLGLDENFRATVNDALSNMLLN